MSSFPVLKYPSYDLFVVLPHLSKKYPAMSDDKDTKAPADMSVVESLSYRPPSSVEQGQVTTKWKDLKAALKQTFLTKDGWIGDYVRSACPTSVAKH